MKDVDLTKAQFDLFGNFVKLKRLRLRGNSVCDGLELRNRVKLRLRA
jgi:hypothetical protein